MAVRAGGGGGGGVGWGVWRAASSELSGGGLRLAGLQGAGCEEEDREEEVEEATSRTALVPSKRRRGRALICVVPLMSAM